MNSQIPMERTVVDRILLGAAPEHCSYIQDLWKEYNPEFWLVPDEPCITLRTSRNKIEISKKTLRTIWLIGFISWKIFSLYGPHSRLSFLFQRNIDDDMLHQDEDYYELKGEFQQLLSVTEKLIESPSLTMVEWPQEVPCPQADKKGLSLEQQATFDIIMIATAYLLLHEMKHVIFNKNSESRPEKSSEEEMECDIFARNFLLDSIDKYVSTSNESKEKVLDKRAMGLALGAFILYEITPECGRAGNSDYPHICDRLENLIMATSLEDDSKFWIWTSTLLIAILHRIEPGAEIPPLLPACTCKYLIDEIRARTYK